MHSRITYLVVGVMLGVAGLAFWNYRRAPASPLAPSQETDIQPAELNEIVHLVSNKQQAAGIETDEVVERSITMTHTVPGRLKYDDTRHIEVKIPTSGILTDILVKPGDVVQAGDILAQVSSPEVGTARADLLRHSDDLQLAKQEYDWKKATADGVDQLVSAVRSNELPDDIGDDVRQVKLGEYRVAILEAYSKYRLAQALSDDLTRLTSSGTIPQRTVKQRDSERESALAALDTELEQASYTAEKESAAAKVAMDDAARRVMISRQHLNTLLGYEDTSLADRAAKDLSVVDVQAPFSGTIESKLFSISERVEQGAALFVLADTSTLWAAADVRERDWQALQLQEGRVVHLTTPALPDQRLTAKVYYVGREVDPQTNAVPLVATVNNESGLLRPGQFVRVELPICEPQMVLAVPDAAVVEHDAQRFVFAVQDDGGYRRVNVKTGIHQDDWVEIVDGLSSGDKIVTRGAFYLKSELLLEREDE